MEIPSCRDLAGKAKNGGIRQRKRFLKIRSLLSITNRKHFRPTSVVCEAKRRIQRVRGISRLETQVQLQRLYCALF